MFRFEKIKRFDTVLFISMVLLIILGLTIQYSLSLSTNKTGLGDFTKQCFFALGGMVLFFLVIFIDFRLIRSSSYLIYFLSILFLIIVLIFGETLRGTKGWLDLGFFHFQPAEMAKLAAVIILAKFWQEARKPLRMKHIFFSFLLIAPFVLLISQQPDLGTALMIIFLWLGIIFLVDKNKKHFLSLLIIIIVLSSLVWFLFLEDYQKNRILSYLNFQGDPMGRDYQINQSIIAVGSGGLFGRGFGLGTQSQLRFLPAGETDFIFAVLAEEFGFLGTSLLLIIYVFLFYRLIFLAQRVYDNFGIVLIIGTMLFLFFQVFINIGMNIGLVPVVGVPLPFVSYGGSSLLFSMIALALVESVVMYQPFTKYENMIK